MKHWFYLPLSGFLLIGCMNEQPHYRPIPPKPVVEPQTPVIKPEKPKKIYRLKEVQDNNFNPEYMYPETSGRIRKVSRNTSAEDAASAIKATETVSRDECISMIGQEKFDKYTRMLGGESGAIKRCAMLRSMK